MTAFRLLVLLVAAALVACDEPAAPGYQGQGEGDYVRVAPVSGGRLTAIHVARGDRVDAGAPLFDLEDDDQRAALAEAKAARAQRAAELEDLTKGSRPAEIDVLEAGRQRAAAALIEAERELARLRKLTERQVASPARLDEAESRQRQARAQVAEFDARIEEARLAAREDRIAAARAALDRAGATVEAAAWQLAQRHVLVPQSARVEDVLYEPGESVGADRPVVVLLPPGNVFVRFFVPEPELGAVRAGARVRLACTGCAEDLMGRIRFIADEVEFAPPVIFSQERQDKLIYRVEASIDPGRASPKPGQPVTVIPVAGGGG